MKLTVTMFITLDGVLQGPGGAEEDRSGGFELGGWLVPFADEDFGRIVVDWVSDADAFLFGRNTYELMASHWPQISGDPMSDALNNLPKYVPSNSLRELSWHNAELLEGELTAAVSELKSRPGRTLQVHGSGRLVHALLRAGLVDELRLLTFPVVLGDGQRLFDTGSLPATWRLGSVETTPAGVIAQTYQYAGAPRTGVVLVGADGTEELQLVN